MTRTLLEKCEIPISSEEKTLLQLAASMAGLSLSAFIRKVAKITMFFQVRKQGNYFRLSIKVLFQMRDSKKP